MSLTDFAPFISTTIRGKKNVIQAEEEGETERQENKAETMSLCLLLHKTLF